MKREYRTPHSPIGNTLGKVTWRALDAVTYFEVNVSIRLHPHTIPANNIVYSDEVGGYLSYSCCAVSSAPVFRLLLYGGFLEDIGAEVEVNQFLSVYRRSKLLKN